MKKRIKTIILILFLLVVNFTKPLTAKSEEMGGYGYIQSSTPILDENYSPIFTLPQTYFVYILSENENYYKISYLDKSGYVDKSHIKKVEYTPKNKYYSKSISLKNDGHPINLRSSPYHDKDNIITEFSERNVTFYGLTKGSKQIEQLGEQWYYIKIEESGQTLWGYVYNIYSPPPKIEENIIEKEESPPNEIEYSDGEISPLLSAIIILCLCLPVIIIMYLLFSPPKKS